MPAVKITRAGIEVNEVPTDLSVLEGRVDAVEAKNAEQDTRLVANGGNISVLQGNVATNATRLDDLALVEAAVTALEELSSQTEGEIDGIDRLISVLRSDTISNDAKLDRVSVKYDELLALNPTSISAQTLEAAINALSPFSDSDLSVTTLATKAQVDLKKDDVSKKPISQVTKDSIKATIDAGVLPLDTVYGSYDDDGVTKYIFDPTEDKLVPNMRFYLKKGDEEFFYGNGRVNVNNQTRVDENNYTEMPFNPVAGLVAAKYQELRYWEPGSKMADVFPAWSNINFQTVVRELTLMEKSFMEGNFATANVAVPDVIARDSEHADKLPIALKSTESILKIDLYPRREDPRGSLTTRYFDLTVEPIGKKYLIVRKSRELYIEDIFTLSCGIWSVRPNTELNPYLARTSIEAARIKTLVASGDDSFITSNASELHSSSTHYDQMRKFSMHPLAGVITQPWDDLNYAVKNSEHVDAWIETHSAHDMYILEQEHGLTTYETGEYFACAVLEKTWEKNNPGDKEDYSTWSIAKELVFEPCGVADKMFRYLDMPAGPTGFLNDTVVGHPDAIDPDQFASAGSYKIPYVNGEYPVLTLNEPSNYWYGDESEDRVGFILTSPVYARMADYAKILSVYTSRGILPDGSRFCKTETMESAITSRMSADEVEASVTLDGTREDCYGSIWRGMTPSTGVARGPGILPAKAYDLELATQMNFFTFDKGRTEDSVLNNYVEKGDFNILNPLCPPQRCIIYRHGFKAATVSILFPDHDTIMILGADDSTNLYLKGAVEVKNAVFDELSRNI